MINNRLKINIFFIIITINFLILHPVFNYLEHKIGYFYTFLIFGAEAMLFALIFKKIMKLDKEN